MKPPLTDDLTHTATPSHPIHRRILIASPSSHWWTNKENSWANKMFLSSALCVPFSETRSMEIIKWSGFLVNDNMRHAAKRRRIVSFAEVETLNIALCFWVAVLCGSCSVRERLELEFRESFMVFTAIKVSLIRTGTPSEANCRDN